FVIVLAVNDDRESIAGAPLNLLPDIEDASARCSDQYAVLCPQVLHLGNGYAKRGKDDNVILLNLGKAQHGILGVAEDNDSFCPQTAIDVRVVDDLSAKKNPAAGKLLA